MSNFSSPTLAMTQEVNFLSSFLQSLKQWVENYSKRAFSYTNVFTRIRWSIQLITWYMKLIVEKYRKKKKNENTSFLSELRVCFQPIVPWQPWAGSFGLDTNAFSAVIYYFVLTDYIVKKIRKPQEFHSHNFCNCRKLKWFQKS